MSNAPSNTPVVTHIVSGDLWAGAEVQVFNLCRGLINSGAVRPTAVLFNEGLLSERLRGLGMTVDIADEKQLGPLAMIRIIKRHCESQASRVVHTHGFKENILGIVGKDLAGVPRSVRTVHGNPESRFTLAQVHKWAIRQLDLALGRFRQNRIIAVSTQLESRLAPLFPGKVEKIFNFIDVDDLRSRWPGSPKTERAALRLGIVGRLVPVKRVDLFIDTIAQLNQRGLDCTGTVIGTGPLEQDLRNHAASLGISERIEFMGFVDPAADALRQLDCLLMTSDHEGLPMTLLEALALEIPVVAHNTGGIPEVLGHGQCGWLVDRHSADGYADAVVEAVAPNDTNRQRPEAGLLQVRRLFGLVENTEKYINLYLR